MQRRKLREEDGNRRWICALHGALGMMLVVYMCDHFCVFDNLVSFPVWLYFLSAGNFFLTVAGNRIDFAGS